MPIFVCGHALFSLAQSHFSTSAAQQTHIGLYFALKYNFSMGSSQLKCFAMRIKYNACAIPMIAKIVHSQKLMREGTRNRNTTWGGLSYK